MKRNRWRGGALALALPFFMASPSIAQDDDVKGQIEELKKGQQDILQELADIKKLLQGRGQPAGPNVAGKVFALGDNPTRGANTATLTLLEFTDYQ